MPNTPLRPRPSPRPFQSAPAIALAQLRAHLALGPRWQRRLARRLRTEFPESNQIVDSAVGRQFTVIGAIQVNELAHFMQPRSHPISNAEQQRVRIRRV